MSIGRQTRPRRVGKVSEGACGLRQSDVRNGSKADVANTLPPARQRRAGFLDQFGDDRRDRFLALDHPDRLAGHHRPALDIAVDHRAAQRADPRRAMMS